MRFIWYRGRKISKKSGFIDVYGDFISGVLKALIVPLLLIGVAIICCVFSLILPYIVMVLSFIFYPIGLVLDWIGSVLGITSDLSVEKHILLVIGFICFVWSSCIFVLYIVSRFRALYVPLTIEEYEKYGGTIVSNSLESAYNYGLFIHRFMWRFPLPFYTYHKVWGFIKDNFHISIVRDLESRKDFNEEILSLNYSERLSRCAILFATGFWLVILNIGILILLNYSEILEFLFCG